jgi:hypothetical protein
VRRGRLFAHLERVLASRRGPTGVALDMNGAPTTGDIFTGTNLETRFRAALLSKAGAEVVSKQDFAIGDLSVAL